jgi:hypothetical protein
MPRRLIPMVAVVLALSAPAAAMAGGPAAGVQYETRLSGVPTSPANRNREPILAAHPTDPNRLAMVYVRGEWNATTAIVRISHDGGRTWVTALGTPTGGGNHPVIAWGPGPKPGSARLYYMAMTGSSNLYYFALNYSDDEGNTWSDPFVSWSTRPWFGGYPDLTVDNDPASPNYGVIYAAYDWPADQVKGPGLRVLASSDFGRTFHGIEVPVAPRPAGYGATWHIGDRITTARDGSLYVAFYQQDMAAWRFASPFVKGDPGNLGRIGYSVARLLYRRDDGSFARSPTVMATVMDQSIWNLGQQIYGLNVGLTDPAWSLGLVVDPVSGVVHLAVGADGGIRLCSSSDQGRTWSCRALPAAAPFGGNRQWSFRPNLVMGPSWILLTLHTLDRSTDPSVGNDYSISRDGGRTWTQPTPVTASRWSVAPMSKTYNWVGLRDRAVLLAGGRRLFFAYGDARLASIGSPGLAAIYGALIDVPGWPTPDTRDPHRAIAE